MAQEKIKKAGEELSIDLVKTVDILAEVGKQKSANQVIVGFALETNNEEENAKQKIVKKNLDMIVLNSLKDTGAGFQHDTNQIMIIDKENNSVKFELKSKLEVAVDINNYIESKFFST
jgi:phosphopantothenoylcysteine decarboxylase/phosphopantothenate--cysteine ligase